MIAQKIAERYSKALMEMLKAEDRSEHFLKQLSELVALLQSHNEFYSIMSSPVVNKTVKFNILKKISDGKIEPELQHFLTFLIRKNRFIYLPEITHEFEENLLEKKGIIKVKMITSIEVEKHEREQLKSNLESSSGKKVILEEIIDPQIKGGGILIYGNRIFDNSIKSKLERLKYSLLSH
jgi:F-type H+-transporting ATPase subunit delta